jgi:hypothetical protein
MKAVSSPSGQSLVDDRVEQVLVVAHREVGAADRALEQHVADQASFEGGWWKTTWPGVWPGQ